jgi:hypothetical protein
MQGTLKTYAFILLKKLSDVSAFKEKQLVIYLQKDLIDLSINQVKT